MGIANQGMWNFSSGTPATSINVKNFNHPDHITVMVMNWDTDPGAVVPGISGWTEIIAENDGNAYVKVYWKHIFGIESTTWTWANSAKCLYAANAYTGVDTTTPIHIEDARVEDSATNIVDHTTNIVNVVGSGRWLTAAFTAPAVGFNNWTVTGLTLRSTSGDGMHWVGDSDGDTAAGSYSYTGSGPNTTDAVMVVVGLNPLGSTGRGSLGSASGGPPTPRIVLPWEMIQLDELTPEQLNQNFQAIADAYNQHTH